MVLYSSPTLIDAGAPGSIGTAAFPYTGLLSRTDDNGAGPKAYLNWLVFDRDFNYKDGGFRRLSSTPREQGQDVAHEHLAYDLTIKEAGYVYIYLSNESETSVEVFFDDFKVEHVKGPVVQMEDYYPFGLTFNSYQRENSTVNQYRYNGKEKQDELDLGWLGYGARMYMPEIGRFSKPDIFSGMSSSYSPYGYAENDPVNATDLGGNFKFPVEFRRKYPKVTAYLEKTLPLLQYNERIINTLYDHTLLDKDQMKNDFQNNNGPSLSAWDFAEDHWGNNSVIGHIDLNMGMLQTLENGLSTNDPQYRKITDIYKFMVIMTILHEFVHEADKRTGVIGRGGEFDEGSLWERDMFGRFMRYPTNAMALSYPQSKKTQEFIIHNTVESFMESEPSMRIFIVISEPRKEKKPDADKKAAKRSGGG